MATGHKNNKSQYKGIRFPHELIEEIELAMNGMDCSKNTVSFSSWVIDACEMKLSKQKSQKKK
ncbi:YlcI/YnfO family protein [Morganella morganii]|jgi:hypothetical protein|nr:DUF3950 domain-containing protein [Morganella morganii]HEI8950909.1 DUF3950 domain-containing protein [Morganella morganii]